MAEALSLLLAALPLAKALFLLAFADQIFFRIAYVLLKNSSSDKSVGRPTIAFLFLEGGTKSLKKFFSFFEKVKEKLRQRQKTKTKQRGGGA